MNTLGAEQALYQALKALLAEIEAEYSACTCGCGGCPACYAERVIAHVEGTPHAHGPDDALPPCAAENRLRYLNGPRED